MLRLLIVGRDANLFRPFTRRPVAIDLSTGKQQMVGVTCQALPPATTSSEEFKPDVVALTYRTQQDLDMLISVWLAYCLPLVCQQRFVVVTTRPGVAASRCGRASLQHLDDTCRARTGSAPAHVMFCSDDPQAHIPVFAACTQQPAEVVTRVSMPRTGIFRWLGCNFAWCRCQSQCRATAVCGDRFKYTKPPQLR